MMTKQELISQGYAEDWATECQNCKSWNCHAYADCIVCFDCKNKVYLKNSECLFYIEKLEQKDYEKAKELNEVFSTRTIFSGSGDKCLDVEIGKYGEIAFENLLIREKILYETHYAEVLQYGDEFDFKINGKTYDLKTQQTNIIPNMNYLGVVNAIQKNNDIDYYVFAYKRGDFVYFVGFIDKKTFFEKAQYMEKGSLMESKTPCLESMYRFPIKDLKPMFMLGGKL